MKKFLKFDLFKVCFVLLFVIISGFCLIKFESIKNASNMIVYADETPTQAQLDEREPGLYQTGTLTKTVSWDIVKTYFTYDNGHLFASDEKNASVDHKSDLVGDLVFDGETDWGGDVTDTSDMFYNCNGLTSIFLKDFDTSKVTNMSRFFAYCEKVKTIYFGDDFTTKEVVNMGVMFCSCPALTSIDLSRFDTSKVEDMGGMFSGCTSLTSLDLGDFDTSNVTDFGLMFSGCFSLSSLDISNFDTSNAESFNTMFGSEIQVPKNPYEFICLMDIEFDQETNITQNDIKTKQDAVNYLLASYEEMIVDSIEIDITDSVDDIYDDIYDWLLYNYSDILACSSLTELDLSSFTINEEADVDDFLSGLTGLVEITLPSKINVEIDMPATKDDYYWAKEEESTHVETAGDKTDKKLYLFGGSEDTPNAGYIFSNSWALSFVLVELFVAFAFVCYKIKIKKI